MNYKKYVKHMGVAAALFSGLLFPTAAYAEPISQDDYETKEVEAYLFDKDHTMRMELVFKKDLPEIAYIDATDFLNRFYKDQMTESLQEDGTILISSEKRSMKVDTEKDVVYISDYEGFFWDGIDQGASMETPYAKQLPGAESGEEEAVSFDFGAYDIDLLEIGGKAYFPVPTISDMFAPVYNGAQYLNEKLYFIHTAELMESGPYYDNKGVFQQTERSESEAEYTYNELCFMMDHYYGYPVKAGYSAVIKEKGFDAALEADKGLKTAKKYLKSTSNAEYMLGRLYLQVVLNDGGHTDFFADFLVYATQHPDEPLSKEFKNIIEDQENEEAGTMYQLLLRILMKRDNKKEELMKEKLRGFDFELETVKSWYKDETKGAEEEGNYIATLYEAGDMVIFTFDSFDSPVVYAFKEAVDYAAAHGKKNFVVDVTTNGGGLTSVYGYMITLMRNKDRSSNQLTETLKYVFIDKNEEATTEYDLNLDGVFDDKDSAVGYDLNFAVLESEVAFSSGNMFPILAKEYGIPVLGETSGGGECNLALYFCTNGLVGYLSGPLKSVVPSGAVVDYGAEPHYPLVKMNDEGEPDYSQMYDAKLIDRLIHEYYGDYTNEWVDGVWYNKDHKASYAGIGQWTKKEDGCWTYKDSLGWFPKNKWQKIDGSWYFFDKDGCMEADAYRGGYYLKKNGAWDGKAKAEGWKLSTGGYWYALKAVNCLRDGWAKIDGKWYYFKNDGYAARNEWVKGYYWIGSGSVWSYSAKGSWHKNSRGWWFGDTTGWYAKNTTVVIDGRSYSFDAQGFMK